MNDFPYISGIEITAIKNREFVRIETDKAQEIAIALDKSGIPFSARFGDAEMMLTYDGSFKEQVEDIIAKAQSGEYEALLRELQVYGEPDGYYRLLGEVAFGSAIRSRYSVSLNVSIPSMAGRSRIFRSMSLARLRRKLLPNLCRVQRIKYRH